MRAKIIKKPKTSKDYWEYKQYIFTEYEKSIIEKLEDIKNKMRQQQEKVERLEQSLYYRFIQKRKD